MKRSILMLLVLSAALILLGCEQETIQVPGSDLNDQDETALKGAKVGLTFEGICSFVKPVPNTWYDDMDDWRVTGTTIWIQPDEAIFEGTATLFVEPRNPHEKSGGKWEMSWEGTITPNADGAQIVAKAEGIGVEGKVKGKEATWTYTMNYVGTLPPDPTNPTFFYEVTGSIIPPGQGKQHKN